MTWHATLDLRYTRQHQRTVAHHHHKGPLRVLQSLYPEGNAVCHNVLVHPPGGLVGGDTLTIKIEVQPEAHGLVTTPGATRFYKSATEPAVQSVHAQLAPGARLEWLPLEALAYNQCRAENKAVFELAPGAELMGWDITALGLPEAGLPFVEGTFAQHIEVPGVWREQGRIDATDLRLMDGPLGLAGQRCMATLFFVAGSPIERTRREQALEVVRTVLAGHALHATAGATSPHPQVLVLRVLAPLVEPALELLKQARAEWRKTLWEMAAVPPRVWAT
ncbi:MAG: urease accessory protein UreD [Pseudomonadota bacterium]|jgi:urease accessory protein|uniref:urease accessory protein UreD n=1 Tax=Curvibacter delicatus TaxID=80879 RepID=UPI00082D3274|nr:urease accessory protein UreD [Curvibacter delicatus]MEA3395328.1 urease accessory protein UreD [Pseudomonadota bacterium]